MKTTKTITYRYDVDGQTIEITRTHDRTAYARNGNVGNPTEYFWWQVRRNGEYLGGVFRLRADAYEAARGNKFCNADGRAIGSGPGPVRPYTVVAAEMRANYRGRS